MTAILKLTVNGADHALPVIPGEMLAVLLRERLRLTGTKIGCGESECGSCTVLVDGEPVLSCMYPAERAGGKSILTIEGLAQPASPAHETVLHPLQTAFVEHGAAQCGFCIPGQIMTAYALLQRNPNPTVDDIRDALKDTLCRCGGYPAIEQAVGAAAEALRTGEPVRPPKIQESRHAQAVVGRTQIRPDAIEKVTGEAIYADDLQFPGMLYGSVRRAMVPHAMLTRLDASKARALSGVRAVLTAADIPGEHNHGLVIFDWPVLVGVGERVRYVGDGLAIVAAATPEIARQAAALIEVELEPQPVIHDAVEARQPGVPQLHESGNLLKHIKVRKGDLERGFAESDVTLEHTFHTPIY